MGFKLDSVKEWSEAVQAFLRFGKEAVGELPDGPAKDEAQAALERAREKSLLAEVQLANAVGYKLCRRHYPPQIMLSIGRDSRWNIEQFKCQTCGDLQPSDLFLRSLDKDEAALRKRESTAA